MHKFSIVGFRATTNRKKRIHGSGWSPIKKTKRTSKGGKPKKNASWFNPLAYLYNNNK